jgi:hypothetical protein
MAALNAAAQTSHFTINGQIGNLDGSLERMVKNRGGKMYLDF